jgi:hypothetical protein
MLPVMVQIPVGKMGRDPSHLIGRPVLPLASMVLGRKR